MKKTNKNILRCLKMLQDGQFHDDINLSTKLEITHMAVWQTIQKLKEYGVDIQTEKVKGYALKEPLILLEKNKITKLLKHKILLDIFQEIDSTNDYLRQFCNGDPDRPLRVCIAETQNSGKGRFHRQWYSPFGRNIYLSMLYAFPKEVSELSGLSLVLGLAVCKAIISVAELETQAQIKWPNDIVWSGQKLAGNLIEVQAEASGNCDIVIGLGVNVNMLEDPDIQIGKEWTSLRKLTGQYYDRNVLCAAIITRLLTEIERFQKYGFKDFLNDWKSSDYLFGKNIHLKCGHYAFQGTMLGVDEQGHLLLKQADGTQKAFSSGDTTLALE